MPRGNDTIEESRVYQYQVYEVARNLIVRNSLNSVLDIGCGMGMKLAKLIYPVCKDITAIDEPGTVTRCKTWHNFGKWYGDNIEESSLNLNRTFDLIISADVIEHLVDPDKLLLMIKRYATMELGLCFPQ